MKKIISSLSALALVAAMAAPMASFADEPTTPTPTTISPTGGDPFNVNPNPASANTEVEFSVNPSYTVTIPAKITLTKATGESGIYEGSGDIEAEDVFIQKNQKIVVKLASDFALTNATATGYTLGYTVKKGEDAIANEGTVAEFETFTSVTTEADKKVTLDFATVEAPQYAGSYTDTVTFNISIATNGATPTPIYG